MVPEHVSKDSHRNLRHPCRTTSLWHSHRDFIHVQAGASPESGYYLAWGFAVRFTLAPGLRPSPIFFASSERVAA